MNVTKSDEFLTRLEKAKLKAADAALRAEVDRLVDSIHDRCAQRGPRVTRL